MKIACRARNSWLLRERGVGLLLSTLQLSPMALVSILGFPRVSSLMASQTTVLALHLLVGPVLGPGVVRGAHPFLCFLPPLLSMHELNHYL